MKLLPVGVGFAGQRPQKLPCLAGAGLNPHWNIHANLAASRTFCSISKLHEHSGQG